MPDEGAMGVEGSMAMTLGTVFCFGEIFVFTFFLNFFIQAYKSNLESGLPLGTCYCHLYMTSMQVITYNTPHITYIQCHDMRCNGFK